MGRKMGRKSSFSINALLKESGYTDKTIKEILKFYGQHKTEK
jgi:predicted Ser/Thr protein kinase